MSYNKRALGNFKRAAKNSGDCSQPRSGRHGAVARYSFDRHYRRALQWRFGVFPLAHTHTRTNEVILFLRPGAIPPIILGIGRTTAISRVGKGADDSLDLGDVRSITNI